MKSQHTQRERPRERLTPRDSLELYDSPELQERLGLSGFVCTASLFTCEICCHKLPDAEAVSLPTSCHHGPVCRNCLTNHLADQILTHGRALVSEHHPQQS